MSSTSRSTGGLDGVWIDGLILKSVLSTSPSVAEGAGLQEMTCCDSEVATFDSDASSPPQELSTGTTQIRETTILKSRSCSIFGPYYFLLREC